MIATLQPGKKYEGFAPGKEYKYYDQYNVEQAVLSFHFLADDNGKKRKLTEREFTMHFYGKYSDE